MEKIRNSNIEIRNNSQIQMIKCSKLNIFSFVSHFSVLYFEFRSFRTFEFVSNFGFRASDFGIIG
jgi:hypothetical protein